MAVEQYTESLTLKEMKCVIGKNPFGYGRKWTIEKMKETVIKLPGRTDGTPDYIYGKNI